MRPLTRSVAAAYGWPRYRSTERTSLPIRPAMGERLIGTYAIPGLGTFSIAGDGGGLAISLKDGTSEPPYASGPNTDFVLSSDFVMHVTTGATPVGGRIVTGPFDVPFGRES